MAKTKNASGNWLETLSRLIEIIKTEYPEGGRFPPVPEMSRRLHVAENTYCKALRSVCTHGLARSRAGRGGTMIVAPAHRRTKIGILTHSMLSKKAFGVLSRQTLDDQDLALQIVDTPPEKLLEHLLVLNIGALYAVNPRPEFYPHLKKLHERNFPVALLEFYNYSKIEEAMEFDLPYFHLDPECVAEDVRKFAEAKGFGDVMLVDEKRTILTQSFETVYARHGGVFTERHFLPFTKVSASLAARVKQLGIGLIYTKCSDMHAELICEQLLKLPEQRRPALVLSEDVRQFMSQKFPGVHVAGYFDFDTETYEIACARLLDALRETRKVIPEKIMRLRINETACH